MVFLAHLDIIFCTHIFILESQPRTSCFLVLLWGAHFCLLPCDPVSVRPRAARHCGAGCAIGCLQNEMGCFITSPSGSCLPGIHIPAMGDTWPSQSLTVRRCASVHHKTATSVLCKDIGGVARSILSGMGGSRSDGNMPGVHFILSAYLTFSQEKIFITCLLSWHDGEERIAVSWAACCFCFSLNILANWTVHGWHMTF